MDQELAGAIKVLEKRVEQKARELVEAKRLVNSLCREVGQEPLYSDSEMDIGSAVGTGSLRSDQFYGKSPIRAAREYLELRAKALPLEEILQGLTQGGFDFDSQGWSEPVRLRNLGISLGKNTAIFHRLPSNTIGLIKWYPDVKQKKAAKSQQAGGDAPETGKTEEGTEIEGVANNTE